MNFILDSLPSAYRRVLAPIADTTAVILPLLDSFRSLPLVDAIRKVLLMHNGIRIPAEAFDKIVLPLHLKVRFRIKDEDGKILAESRDLDEALEKAGVEVKTKAEEIIEKLPPPKPTREQKELERQIREILLMAKALPDDIYDSIETQVAWLTFPGWERLLAPERLAEYPRFLRAIRKRIERAKTNPTGDRSKDARFEPWWEQYTELVSNPKAIIADRAALSEYRWLLEEYRISLFAQELGTRVPASPNRLAALWVKATTR